MTKQYNRAGREGGFSLLEATLAASLTLTLAYLVTTLSLTGMRTQKYAERSGRVTEIAQDLMDGLRRSLSTSIRVLNGSVIGKHYVSMFDLDELPPPIKTARMPMLSVDGLIERDKSGGTLKTGNDLSFVRFAWADEFTTTAGNTYRIDIYRFERYYLTPAGEGITTERPDGLNLAHFVSEPIADGGQIDSITDPIDQAEVLIHLLTASTNASGETYDPVEVVWLVGDDPTVAGTLRQIGVIGDLMTAPQLPRNPTWEIEADLERSDQGLLYYRHHSIATVHAPDTTPIGRFGMRDRDGDGFPHGFEVQVVGPASARQVLVHLTLVSTNNNGHRAYHDMQVVVDLRDV